MTPEEKALSAQVAPRLRAIMAEYRVSTVDDFAAMTGAQRNAASNWLNGYNLPPVWRMMELCRSTELTLDWIYRGEGRGMPIEIVQSLNRRVRPGSSSEKEPGAPGAATRKPARVTQKASWGKATGASSPRSRAKKRPADAPV